MFNFSPEGGVMSYQLLYDQIGIGGEPYQKGQWQKIATHNETCIKGFFGPFRFLSNMWLVEVWLDGHKYPSVENAYQAAKFTPSERAYFMTCSPYEAKQASIGKSMQYSKEVWDAMKVSVMRMLLLQKFNRCRNPELYDRLKDTCGKYLEETNWWHDVFWGCNAKGDGANNLGKLHMEIRDL